MNKMRFPRALMSKDGQKIFVVDRKTEWTKAKNKGAVDEEESTSIRGIAQFFGLYQAAYERMRLKKVGKYV